QRAVPDAAVIAVIKAVELDHQDPDRGEREHPEQRGGRGTDDRQVGDRQAGEKRDRVREGEEAPEDRAASPRGSAARDRADRRIRDSGRRRRGYGRHRRRRRIEDPGLLGPADATRFGHLPLPGYALISTFPPGVIPAAAGRTDGNS